MKSRLQPLKITKQMKEFESQFVPPRPPRFTSEEQNRQINRLWYYWHYTFYRKVFHSPFIIFANYLSIKGHESKRLQIKLRATGIRMAILKSKMAKDAAEDSPCKDVGIALTQNTVAFFSQNQNDRICFRYNKTKRILKIINEFPDLTVLFGFLEQKFVPETEIDRVFLNSEISPARQLASALNSLPHTLLPTLCQSHQTNLLKILKFRSTNSSNLDK